MVSCVSPAYYRVMVFNATFNNISLFYSSAYNENISWMNHVCYDTIKWLSSI